MISDEKARSAGTVGFAASLDMPYVGAQLGSDIFAGLNSEERTNCASVTCCITVLHNFARTVVFVMELAPRRCTPLVSFPVGRKLI